VQGAAFGDGVIACVRTWRFSFSLEISTSFDGRGPVRTCWRRIVVTNLGAKALMLWAWSGSSSRVPPALRRCASPSPRSPGPRRRVPMSRRWGRRVTTRSPLGSKTMKSGPVSRRVFRCGADPHPSVARFGTPAPPRPERRQPPLPGSPLEQRPPRRKAVPADAAAR
jgi:hypothetical protein